MVTSTGSTAKLVQATKTAPSEIDVVTGTFENGICPTVMGEGDSVMVDVVEPTSTDVVYGGMLIVVDEGRTLGGSTSTQGGEQ